MLLMTMPVQAGKPGIRACTGVGTRRRGTTVRALYCNCLANRWRLS